MWTPTEGDHNYTTNGAKVTPDAPAATKGATPDSGNKGGTPSKGKIRTEV